MPMAKAVSRMIAGLSDLQRDEARFARFVYVTMAR